MTISKFFFIIVLLSVFTSKAQDVEVYFNSGSHTLKLTEKVKIDSVITTLEHSRKYLVNITGHTDSIGNLNYNSILSYKRASEIEKTIKKHKPTFDFNLIARAYKTPQAQNNTEIGRSKNRRTTIRFQLLPIEKVTWEINVYEYLIQNDKQNIITSKNGCKLTIEPYSFINNEEDTVRMYITEYNDPTDFLSGGFPMSYTKGNDSYMYHSEQMMKIEAHINGKPTSLKKLITLDCPNVDTLDGVKFYEFQGQKKENWISTKKNITSGNIVYKQPIYQQNKQEDINEIEDQILGKPAASKNIKRDKESLESKVLDKTLKLELKKNNGFILTQDTGNAFILRPDTIFYNAIHKNKINTSVRNNSQPLLNPCEIKLCDSTEYGNYLKIMGDYLTRKIDSNPSEDFTSFYDRYINLSYDGLIKRSLKPEKEQFTVKTKIHKRLFRNQLIIKLEQYSLNPEYEPLKKVKWIARYDKTKKEESEKLKEHKYVDFRLLAPSNFKSFSLELKTKDSLFLIKAKPKGKKRKTIVNYHEYEHLYLKKIKHFKDSLKTYISKHDIQDYFCLYTFNQSIINSYKNCGGYTYQCINPEANEPTYLGNLQNHKEDIETFVHWKKYFNTHQNEMQKRYQKLLGSKKELNHCFCTGRSCEGKWEHTNPYNMKEPIILIGLGVYNFDRVILIHPKIKIESPVFITEQGDTIMKCSKYSIKNKASITCNHDIYTILPSINGLLKHNRVPSFDLVMGEINILLLSHADKRYKVIVDLRDKKTFEKTTFVVKDITEQATIPEKLRKELLLDLN